MPSCSGRSTAPEARRAAAFGADIVIRGGIRGDRDPKLHTAIAIYAYEQRRHIRLSDVVLVHLNSKATLVYVVR